ncbi:hypothetical protein NPX13_g8782 [Xylaria arbuscula]|uniref:NAD(P)-binding protein n=1 Tax=Xylaria arbuscula TaxID=114810 RepID=A0A9W8TI31_9PEZI|nr:hypothetical protein NPX13_g8782 [Xylaria arbuscula]
MAVEPPVLTWLVTGASSGLGLSISLAALAAGQKVIGCSRDISKAAAAHPSFAAKGGIWIQLDPAHPDSARHFAQAQAEYDIDVLVNNAGYSFIGGVEDTSEDEVMDQMNVNFLGPLRAIRAMLPGSSARKVLWAYRADKQRHRVCQLLHHITLHSTTFPDNPYLTNEAHLYYSRSYMNPPGRSTYKASKSAIESIHEILSPELSPFGIKVLIVEPGSFRTSWTANLKTPIAHEATSGFSEAYKGTPVEQWVGRAPALKTGPLPDFIRGDPDDAGRAIIKAVIGGYEGTRFDAGARLCRCGEAAAGGTAGRYSSC